MGKSRDFRQALDLLSDRQVFLSRLDNRVKYIELFGLPGAGKTTLVRMLNKAKYFQIRSGSSFGLRSSAPGQSTAGLGLFIESSKVRILDYWAFGSFSHYPQLLSEVLKLVAYVPPQNRGRAIVLNYWRARLRAYTLAKESGDTRIAVVDEGLLQTLLTTCIRTRSINTEDPRTLELIRNIIRELPPVESVVFLMLPHSLVRKRIQKKAHWALNQTTVEWLETITLIARQEGIEIANVDACQRDSEVHQDFLRITSQLP